MAGHSHFANIMRAKARTDARRGRAFAKLSNAITVAARLGGGRPEDNPRLALAIEKARHENMPKDTIARAIAKGAGGGAGPGLEEVVYEAFGPGGVGMLVLAVTDNRNRTGPAVREILARNGGAPGAAGSVAWNFDRKGEVRVPAGPGIEERLFEVAVPAGAEDVAPDHGVVTVTAPVARLAAVRRALEEAHVPVESFDVVHVPRSLVTVDEASARRLLALVRALEEHDDVDSVATNADVPEDLALRLEA